MSVLAVGTVAFDSIETPFGSVDHMLGGSATYITLAARMYCDNVRLVGVVGKDFPEDHITLLKNRGIDVEGLEVDQTGKTFAWAGRYHSNFNERDTLATHLNVLETFDPELPDAYKDSKLVCLGNLDPTIQRQVLEQVNAPDLVICDTMNFWIEHTPDSLQETLKLVDCLLINDSEARQLAEEHNLVIAAKKIMEMGPRLLVIKKGEHGAMLFSRESLFIIPAFPLEHIEDPTGAGDTFMGGFVGALARMEALDDRALRQAIVCGSSLASFSVERFGPHRLLDLSDEEVRARVHAFRRITEIPLHDLTPA